MKVRWAPTAARHLEALHAYIAKDSRDAAGRMIEKIVQGIDALTDHPSIGRAGRVTGTRELVIAPFVVAYRSNKDAIEVLAILHGSQRWPDSF